MTHKVIEEFMYLLKSVNSSFKLR